MSKKRIPQSSLERAGRLLLSGARIATREVTGRIAARLSGRDDDDLLKVRILQTQELVAVLSQLKGAAMKAGQLVSLEFSDLLPPEVNDILRKLHDESTVMPFDQVRYILSRELGADRLSALEELSPTPIAAASIGQVHRAVLGGRAVAVKVQFPGIAGSIDADLGVLRRATALWLQARGKNIDLDGFFDEITQSLKREANYLIEAENAERYGRMSRHPSFVVPEVVREFTSERVLTLSYEEGVRISDWLAAKPDAEAVRRFAGCIIELLIEEFYVHGLVQTDPNYGNFLYRPAQGQLVLLDFGATVPYSVPFRLALRELMVEAIKGDDARLIELLFEQGLLDRRESDEVVRLFSQLVGKVIRLFRPEFQPFRFHDGRYLQELRETSFEFIKKVQHTKPAQPILFLNRKIGGMYHLLKDLGAEVDLTPYLERALGLTIADS